MICGRLIKGEVTFKWIDPEFAQVDSCYTADFNMGIHPKAGQSPQNQGRPAYQRVHSIWRCLRPVSNQVLQVVDCMTENGDWNDRVSKAQPSRSPSGFSKSTGVEFPKACGMTHRTCCLPATPSYKQVWRILRGLWSLTPTQHP